MNHFVIKQKFSGVIARLILGKQSEPELLHFIIQQLKLIINKEVIRNNNLVTSLEGLAFSLALILQYTTLLLIIFLNTISYCALFLT